MIFARLLLQVWVLAFVGFFGSELLAGYPDIRVATQILFVAPLAVWAALRMRGPRNALEWTILSAISALVIVSLASADPQGSLETVGLALAYAVAFAAMRDIGRMPRLRTAAAVAASYALIFWMVLAALWWISEKITWTQAFGTIPNLESYQVFVWGTANAYPVMALLAIPLLCWQPAGRPRRLLAIVWLVSSVIVVPFSAGRAGWLAFSVAAISFEALSGWPRLRSAVRWIAHRRLWVPASLMSALTAVVFLVVVLPKLGELIRANFDARYLIWEQAAAIFAADPVTGGGPGTFSWLRLTHVPDYNYAVSVRLSHNVAMQTLADGGLLLALALAAMLTAFVTSALRQSDDPRRRATFAVLIGFGAASLLDDFSSLPAIMGIVVVLAAWTTVEDRPAQRGRPWLDLGMPVAVLVIGLAVLPSIVGVDLARLAGGEGRNAAVAGDWHAAAAGFRRATDAYPTGAGYWLGLGLADWESGDSSAATTAYRTAAVLSPGDPRPWGALAALTEDASERIDLLEQAARRTVTDPQYSFRLGDALRLAGRTDEALHAYGVAVAIAPEVIVAFPPLTPPSEGEQPMPDAHAVATAAQTAATLVRENDFTLGAEGVRWDLDLALGRMPPTTALAWRAIALARAGDLLAAQTAAEQAFAAAPYTDLTQRAKAAMAIYACDRTSYDRIAAWLGPFRPTRLTGPADVRDNTYRDNGLGSYQPLAVYPLPPSQAWPWSLIGDPPACPGWSP